MALETFFAADYLVLLLIANWLSALTTLTDCPWPKMPPPFVREFFRHANKRVGAET